MSSPISGLGLQGGYLPLAAAAADTGQATSTGSGTAGALGGTASSTSGSSTTSSSATSSNTSISSLSGTDTFLQLLVAQLKNQDPSSPMDTQSFVTELAQFNTVEQMLSLNQSIQTQTSAQQTTEGVAMLGKTVAYTVPGVGNNPSTTASGVVQGVSMSQNQTSLQIGTQQIPISEVTSVS